VRIRGRDHALVNSASVIIIAVAGNEALRRAQVGVGDSSGGGNAIVASASSISSYGLGGGNTGTSSTRGFRVTRVGLALISRIVTSGGSLGYGGTASSLKGSGGAEVGRNIATIGGDAATASAESTASSACGAGTTLLAGFRDQTIYERGELIPIGGTENVFGITISDGQQLGLGPNGTYTNTEDGYGGYLLHGILDGPVEIGE
jgi:hypothetical protein